MIPERAPLALSLPSHRSLYQYVCTACASHAPSAYRRVWIQILDENRADPVITSMRSQDYFIYCTFSLALQVLAFLVFASKGKQDADDLGDVFDRVIDLFIAAWPSIAPAVILFAWGVRLTRLRGQGISTLQPDKLDAAAHTEVVCFDKTGTLTANVVSIPVLCLGHCMQLLLLLLLLWKLYCHLVVA